MRPSDALVRHRNEVIAILAKRGLSNPRVFGSIARLEDEEHSDVDILVDCSPGTNLFDLGGAEMELLGFEVDLLTTPIRDGRLRMQVEDASPL